MWVNFKITGHDMRSKKPLLRAVTEQNPVGKRPRMRKSNTVPTFFDL